MTWAEELVLKDKDTALSAALKELQTSKGLFKVLVKFLTQSFASNPFIAIGSRRECLGSGKGMLPLGDPKEKNYPIVCRITEKSCRFASKKLSC